MQRCSHVVAQKRLDGSTYNLLRLRRCDLEEKWLVLVAAFGSEFGVLNLETLYGVCKTLARGSSLPPKPGP
jgi:hypothetical protein